MARARTKQYRRYSRTRLAKASNNGVDVEIESFGGSFKGSKAGKSGGSASQYPMSSPTHGHHTAPPFLAASTDPTPYPTSSPTSSPTKTPTKIPTALPTQMVGSMPPTLFSTSSPTKMPTKIPTASPTKTPTKIPTSSPSAAPVTISTAIPTAAPLLTVSITSDPTKAPTAASVMEEPTSVPAITPIILVPTASPTSATILSPTIGDGDAVNDDVSSLIAVSLYSFRMELVTDGRRRRMSELQDELVALTSMFLTEYISAQLHSNPYHSSSPIHSLYLDVDETRSSDFDAVMQGIAYFESFPIPSRVTLGQLTVEAFEQNDFVSLLNGEYDNVVEVIITLFDGNEDMNAGNTADSVDGAQDNLNSESEDVEIGLVTGVAIAGAAMLLLSALLVLRARRSSRSGGQEGKSLCDDLIYGDIFLDDDSTMQNSLVFDQQMHLHAQRGNPIQHSSPERKALSRRSRTRHDPDSNTASITKTASYDSHNASPGKRSINDERSVEANIIGDDETLKLLKTPKERSGPQHLAYIGDSPFPNLRGSHGEPTTPILDYSTGGSSSGNSNSPNGYSFQVSPISQRNRNVDDTIISSLGDINDVGTIGISRPSYKDDEFNNVTWDKVDLGKKQFDVEEL